MEGTAARQRKAGAEPESPGKDPAPSKPPKKEGYNWSALILLCLFLLGPAMYLGQMLYDKWNPEDAERAAFRNRLYRCWSAAIDDGKAPKGKLDTIDKVAANYVTWKEGRKQRFWAEIGEKYPKLPECQIR